MPGGGSQVAVEVVLGVVSEVVPEVVLGVVVGRRQVGTLIGLVGP